MEATPLPVQKIVEKDLNSYKYLKMIIFHKF